MYTLTKDGVTMQLQSEIQVAAFLKSGWKETRRTATPQEVVLPDPPEITNVTAEMTAGRKRPARKAK